MSNVETKLKESKMEMVSFWLGNQEFCMNIQAVREIRGWTEETELPDSPEHIRGVINLRGVVLPVLDLGAKMRMHPSEPAGRHVIVVVQIQTQMVGLLVDAVSSIFEINEIEIKPKPMLADATDFCLISGFLNQKDRMVKIVNVENLLATPTSVAA